MRVKIIGAGSAGNHLAQAARRMKWSVDVVDRDKDALERMRREIFPQRYGSWDDKIGLFTTGRKPKGNFDIICVATPPDVRISVALSMLRESPKLLLLEKPLAKPFDPKLQSFLREVRRQRRTKVLVGYDHAVSRSVQRVVELLRRRIIGEVLTLDVEFREHWRGIFAAHPWFKGPTESYLGYWRRGGGAASEHSHALHLWFYLAREAHLGKVRRVTSLLSVEREGKAVYDQLAAFTFLILEGKVGRVIQDVLTNPPRKWARLQGREGFIEWLCAVSPLGDVVRYGKNGQSVKEDIFKKRRPDDFYMEMLHIRDIIEGKTILKESPLSLERGIQVLNIIQSAWRISRRTQSVR